MGDKTGFPRLGHIYSIYSIRSYALTNKFIVVLIVIIGYGVYPGVFMDAKINLALV